MPLEPQEVRGKSSEEGLGSLRGCLVEGDAEQRIRERRVRRRALTISILLQSAVLAALILVPLFFKTPRIALAYATPVPPYSSYRSISHNSGPPHAPNGPKNVCHICAPINIPPTIAIHDLPPNSDGTDQTPPEGLGPGIPGAPNDLIPVFDPTKKVRPPERTDHEVTAEALAFYAARSGDVDPPRRADLSAAGKANAPGRPRGTARHHRDRRQNTVPADRCW